MEPALSETPDIELTLRLVDEKIKQATDPILKRVGELCARLASRTEMESAGNSEASGSRRDRELSSPSHKRYDSSHSKQYLTLDFTLLCSIVCDLHTDHSTTNIQAANKKHV